MQNSMYSNELSTILANNKEASTSSLINNQIDILFDKLKLLKLNLSDIYQDRLKSNTSTTNRRYIWNIDFVSS